ncbi:hypothetical protein BH10ACT1_BH10ACT1_05520 [soil metagenome]
MQRRWVKRVALLGALAPVAAVLGSCGPLATGFQQEVVASGFDLPTTWVQTADPAVQYVVEKAGVVRVVQGGTVRAQPLVDLSSRVNDIGDRGLVGAALRGNQLYLAYTYEDPTLPIDGAGQSQRITRVTVDPATQTADPATEQVILGRTTGAACFDHWDTDDCFPSNQALHTVGDLAFDSAGKLWVSVGDGGIPFFNSDEVSYRAQDIHVLAGKVLRIDPDTGLGVAGNPFFEPAKPTSNASRVYAYGFRNPFRFTFRPGSGVPYVGDVGFGRYEEIDVLKAGGNYGWPCYEGKSKEQFAKRAVCQPMYKAKTPHIAPAAYYEHSDQGISITGGVFYAGTSNYPSDHVGNYVYGDYGAFVRRQAFTSSDKASGGATELVSKQAAGSPVKFGIGPDGNVWYLSIYPGELRRIVYTGDTPTSTTSTSTTTTTAPPGTPPSVAVTAPADRVRVADGATVDITATATDAEDGVLPASSVTIEVTYLHYSAGTVHVHPYQTFAGSTTGSFLVSGAHGPGHYRITAKATDSAALTTTSPPIDVCIAGYDYGPCA